MATKTATASSLRWAPKLRFELALVLALLLGASCGRALAYGDCAYEAQSCKQRCIRNGNGDDCVARCNSLSIACGRAADPDVTPPSGSRYIPGPPALNDSAENEEEQRRQQQSRQQLPAYQQREGSGSSNSAQQASGEQSNGHWQTGTYRVTGWGSDKLNLDADVQAVIACQDGSACAQGGYLDLHNWSKHAVKYQSTETGSGTLAPGEQKSHYLPIYRSKNDYRSTVVNLTITYWVDDR